MPTTTYRQRPSWKPGQPRPSMDRQSVDRGSNSQRSPARENSTSAEVQEEVEVPHRGIRVDDVVVFEIPPDNLSDGFLDQVVAATSATKAASLCGSSGSAGASVSEASLAASGRMWYIGHITSLDDEAVELSRVNARFDNAGQRRQALQAKANAAELALEEIACRRRQVENRFLNLEAARRAVSAISPREVYELQSYQHPPAGVRRVLEAVLSILGSPIAGIAGWPAIRTAVRDPHFLDEVNNFDADSMSMERREELRARYEQDPLLLSESSGMLAVSVATRTLRTWVNAQLLYDGLDSNPYHIRGGADVMRLDSRAHALEEDLRVFYELLHGEEQGGQNVTPDDKAASRQRSKPSPAMLLPPWPVLSDPMERIRVPYSWLVCRLDPPVATRTDVLPSEAQFISELWGYRIQDPPPSPEDFPLSVEPLFVHTAHVGESSVDDEAEDDDGVKVHLAMAAHQKDDALAGFGEPVQVSCGHDEESDDDEAAQPQSSGRGHVDGDDEEDDDGDVEVPVDHAAVRGQWARDGAEAVDRYAHIDSEESDPYA